MQVSEFADIILASVNVDESPAAIFENLTDMIAVDACVAVNLTIGARELFAVPMHDGGILIVHEPSLAADSDLRDALVEITVKDGFIAVNKEHLL